MTILGWIIIGGLAGCIASVVTGRSDQQGCLVNIIVGIIGAAISGAIVAFLFSRGVTGLNLAGWIATVVAGAVVLLAIVNLITRK